MLQASFRRRALPCEEFRYFRMPGFDWCLCLVCHGYGKRWLISNFPWKWVRTCNNSDCGGFFIHVTHTHTHTHHSAVTEAPLIATAMNACFCSQWEFRLYSAAFFCQSKAINYAWLAWRLSTDLCGLIKMFYQRLAANIELYGGI